MIGPSVQASRRKDLRGKVYPYWSKRTPDAQCLRRGTFSLIFNSFKNVYFQLVRLIEGILHIVWAEKTFLLIFRVSCCYFNFWMPKKSQNSTFFFKSSSIHCWWFSTKTLTVLYKKKPRLIGFIEKMDQNLWIYPKNPPFLPQIYSIYAKFPDIWLLHAITRY